MHRSMRALIGVTTASAVLVGGATGASAGTGQAVTDGWTADVTVPDFTWTSTSGCEDVPVTVSTAGWGADRLLVDLDARHVQSGSTSGNVYDFDYTTLPATVDDYEYTMGMQLCPFNTPAGTYEVTGTVEYGWSTDYDPFFGTPRPGSLKGDVLTTFTVSKMPSTVRLDQLNPTGTPGEVSVGGRITGTSSKLGVVGVSNARGEVEQFVNGAWAYIGSLYADSLGYYNTKAIGITGPTPMRVTFNGTDSVASSTSAEMTPILPAPSPAPAPAPVTGPVPVVTPPAAPPVVVKVKTTNGGSKLRVDVNPNKGSGYWRFQVQRKNVDQSWKPLKTYKTLGSKETKNVNLRKGAYRVVVLEKYGYRTTESNEVYLKR